MKTLNTQIGLFLAAVSISLTAYSAQGMGASCTAEIKAATELRVKATIASEKNYEDHLVSAVEADRYVSLLAKSCAAKSSDSNKLEIITAFLSEVEARVTNKLGL